MTRQQQGGGADPLWWSLHFEGPFARGDRRTVLVSDLRSFFSLSATGASVLLSGFESGGRFRLRPHVLHLPFPLLLSDPSASDAYASDLKAALLYQPAEALMCLAAAACAALFCDDGAVEEVRALGRALLDEEKAGRGGGCRRMVVRLRDCAQVHQPLRNVRAHTIGRLVSVSGTVVRVGAPRQVVKTMGFRCSKCGEVTEEALCDGRYEPPTSCGTRGCRGRTLTADTSSAVCMDCQTIRLQEVQCGHTEEGRIPGVLDCEAREGLIDSCSAGEVVTAVGIVKMAPDGASSRYKKGKDNNPVQSVYIELCSLQSQSGQSGSGATKLLESGDAKLKDEGGGVDDPRSSVPPTLSTFSDKDLRFIARFSQEANGDQFRQIVNSLCPSILGNELIKAGIVLALAGGVQKNIKSRNRVPTRGDIHMLIVGDPGLGKSKMLQAAASAAPRGVYVCGKGTTSAGLTVAIGRDAEKGGYAFEAGALVLADRGACCVDEFDKLSADYHSLLEAMEQQSISISKAGLSASLPTRTSVIAAANPVKGHYDRARTVNENIKLSNAMLSRFDLVFVLLDEADEARDKHFSEHLIALHSGHAGRKAKAKQKMLESGRRTSGLLEAPGGSLMSSRPSQLEDRLKIGSKEDFSEIPHQLIRKYIAYVRKYVFPSLSQEAKAAFKAFYLELRGTARPADGTPITARQLESMVRLAEARARIELRTEVTEDDALDVIELMRASLLDTFLDERGFVDLRRSGGRSNQGEAKRFLAALNRFSQTKDDAIFTEEELCEVADHIDLGVPDIRAFVDMLNESGELLKRGPGKYKLSFSANSQY